MDITKKMLNSVPFQYANDVLKGRIVTGQNIRLAVEHFFEKIEGNNDYLLDNNAGMMVLNFFPTFLQHTKGPIAGQPFHLSPYQQFTYYNIYGWHRPDPETGKMVRLIRTVYEKVARKNGKTAGVAGLGLYSESFDGVSGPEIYVGATKEQQAKVMWEQAHQFVFKSVALRQMGFKNTQREIRFGPTMGVFRFLGGDSKSLDGLNPNLSVIDEYHAHASDGVREVLESAMGARLNPLTYIITTAGTNIASVCKNYEDVCIDILKGIKKDDSTLIMMHDMDEGDDWENPDNWQKANPNLGVSVSMDYLRTEYIKAVNQPSKAPNFKTKHLNMWVDAYSTHIPDEIWMQNTQKPKLINFLEYGCAGGMDLSSREDLSSYTLVSNPCPDGYVDMLSFNFCPKDTIRQRSKEDRVPYDYWATVKMTDYLDCTGVPDEIVRIIQDKTILIATPGNQIDYDYIEHIILETFWALKVKWIEYDRYKSTELVQGLGKQEVEMHPFSQTVGEYSSPTQEFERLVYTGKFRHGGNPLVRWCVSNIMPFVNNNEDYRYVKKERKKRVDPVQAAVMAIGARMTPEETNESKYNTMEVEDLTANN